MEHLRRFRDRTAAITGAGSGIGRSLAVALARAGASLAISDIDQTGLAETARLCAAASRVTSTVIDVADRSAVHRWAHESIAAHEQIHYVFNNAGVSLTATVADMSHDDFEWLMDINFWGVVHGTRAFLPHMLANDEGHIVNISSVFGLVAIPTQSAYNAAKFAVRGFTESLRMELEIAGSSVTATTIHPGGIDTGIVRNGRLIEDGHPGDIDEAATEFKKMARTSPDAAASAILDAVAKRRRRALIGPDARVFDAMSRLPAAVPQRLMVWMARRERARRR